MISKLKLIYLAGIIFLITFFGCGEKFDKNKWSESGEHGGSDKVLMAEDLIKTKKLIGMTNKQMVQLLGNPENDTTATWYGLKEEGEWLSPDPISTKDLIIKFNKDSIITSAEIKEWHRH